MELKKTSKPRASNYDEKLKFDGNFIDMVKISVKDAEKKATNKEKKN